MTLQLPTLELHERQRSCPTASPSSPQAAGNSEPESPQSLSSSPPSSPTQRRSTLSLPRISLQKPSKARLQFAPATQVSDYLIRPESPASPGASVHHPVCAPSEKESSIIHEDEDNLPRKNFTCKGAQKEGEGEFPVISTSSLIKIPTLHEMRCTLAETINCNGGGKTTRQVERQIEPANQIGGNHPEQHLGRIINDITNNIPRGHHHPK